jgi:hypothetical protein
VVAVVAGPSRSGSAFSAALASTSEMARIAMISNRASSKQEMTET